MYNFIFTIKFFIFSSFYNNIMFPFHLSVNAECVHKKANSVRNTARERMGMACVCVCVFACHSTYDWMCAVA